MKIPNPPAEVHSDQADRYFVPYRCEYPEVNDYADVFYFHHKDVADFWLCGFCFETRIRHTEFASSFEGGIKPKDNKLKCSFGAPRMLENLWPHALQTKDLKPVKEYMEKRVRIKDCYGATGVLGQNAQGVRWFGMRNNDVPGFLACEACYEEMLVGTTFQDNFAFYPHAQGPEDKWSCDLALEYIRHGLVRALKTSDWNAFVSMASRRTFIPACAGTQGVAAHSRKWYKPANPIEGVVTCEACHLDYFGFTQFDQHFIDCPVQDDSASNPWSCDLAPIPVKNAIEAAKKNSDFAPIHATLTSLATIPICANGAVSSNTWYNLTDGTPNFDVCPTCYTGLFACVGLSHLFRPSTTSQTTTRICDLSQHSPRFKEYITNYLSLVNTPGGLPTFLAHIARYAPIPKCARRDPVRNQRWHLLNGLAADLVVCDECHASFTSVTPLADLLVAWPPSSSSPNNNNNNNTTTDPVPRVCDMYSATMRARWTGLCATYNPSNPSTTASLDAFVAFSRHRHRVYEETMPHCRELLQAARLRGEQQRLANTMATHYHSMGLMTGGTGYGLHGGYGGLYAGQAAAAGAQGVGLMMETGADMGRVAVLEKRWEEVE
ncbi:hypothetical protein B0J12DRAFT_584641 [Macrophomina phaseolina]|uniref:Integral membrane protein n=1 Tax=Macrophomina phaseolina TaxID=35725 RepID=A0ABQ8FUI7_9PEZI|nr:hypothetical protein B0J12DRAFT_584641 [Macrophomina phaseolina]